jgi:hypothetical protein
LAPDISLERFSPQRQFAAPLAPTRNNYHIQNLTALKQGHQRRKPTLLIVQIVVFMGERHVPIFLAQERDPSPAPAITEDTDDRQRDHCDSRHSYGEVFRVGEPEKDGPPLELLFPVRKGLKEVREKRIDDPNGEQTEDPEMPAA